MEIMFHEEFGFVWSSTFLSWHFCMSHIGEASILFPVPLSASFFSALDPFIGTKDEVRAKNIKLQRHSWFKVEQERDSSWLFLPPPPSSQQHYEGKRRIWNEVWDFCPLQRLFQDKFLPLLWLSSKADFSSKGQCNLCCPAFMSVNRGLKGQM